MNDWQEFVLGVITEAGDTQAQAAQRADLHQATISKWAHGHYPTVSIQHALDFARAYGVDPLLALIAGGWITPEEAKAHVLKRPRLQEVSTPQLLAELRRRTEHQQQPETAGAA